MSKKLFTAVAVLSAALCAVSVGCSQRQEESKHEHDYVWVEEFAATCKNVGMKAHYKCGDDSCGEVFAEDKSKTDLGSLVIPVTEHNYVFSDNGDGTHSKKCSICEDETKGSHAYTREVADEKFLKTPADCFDAATYYKSCECGKFYDGEDAEIFSYGEKLGHNFVAGVCEHCKLDILEIKGKIEALPNENGLALSDIDEIKSVYAEWSKFDDDLKAEIGNADKVTALYEKVSKIETLSAGLWSVDDVHGCAMSFKEGVDKTYGKYAEIEHTSGWAFFYLNAESVMPSDNVVFYAYNPMDEDCEFTYGYLNDGKTDGVFIGEDRYHVTLKSKKWTRISFKYTMDYPVEHMRFVRGDKAGDGSDISGFKFTAWYLVDEISDITDIVYDKTLDYTFVEKVEPSCEDTGKEAHYTANGKLYNLYKEEVDESELIISAAGHKYNDDGECTGCGSSLKPIIDSIAKLPEKDDLTPSSIKEIKAVYAEFLKLNESAQGKITNADKLNRLYTAVKDIAVYAAKIEHGGQNEAGQTYAGGDDATYGEYAEITHTSDWANFKLNVAETPLDKYVVFYVYNPLDRDLNMAYGTAGTIYTSAACGHFTVKANGWTKVSIKWTYEYQIANLIFCSGEQAGDYTNLTGMKISSVYIVEDSSAMPEVK